MKVLKYFLLVALAIVGITSVGLCANVELTPYYVNTSTYPVTEAATLSAQISGAAYVREIWISNSLSTNAQSVTFYENATSTTAVTTSFSIDIATATSNQMIILDYDQNPEYWKADNIAIRKSSTGSNVKVTIWYW